MKKIQIEPLTAVRWLRYAPEFQMKMGGEGGIALTIPSAVTRVDAAVAAEAYAAARLEAADAARGPQAEVFKGADAWAALRAERDALQRELELVKRNEDEAWKLADDRDRLHVAAMRARDEARAEVERLTAQIAQMGAGGERQEESKFLRPLRDGSPHAVADLLAAHMKGKRSDAR